jgi:hypothetical protein
MRWLAGLAEAVVLAATVGACSSSTSSITASPKAIASPMSETETLIGTMTGAAAATWLNSYGAAPPSFASLVFTGPVDTLTGPVTVVSGAPGSVMGFGGSLRPAGLPSGGICPLCGFRCWHGAGWLPDGWAVVPVLAGTTAHRPCSGAALSRGQMG